MLQQTTFRAMKRNRLNRVKAYIRKYRYTKNQTVNQMRNGDLDDYLKSLKDLYESKERLKDYLVPVYRN